MFKSQTPQYLDHKGNPLKESIAAIEEVTIGGVQQTIMLRGKDVKNPILLFLHGGPGFAQIGFARQYQSELEKHFVVVNWDQRGTGKSYSKTLSKDSLSLEQIVKDAHELITLILQRFGQKKLFLVGHCWGSIVGAMVAKQYPDLLHSYIGVGQMVHVAQSEMISYQLILIHAQSQGFRRAIKQLNQIGYPPFKSINGNHIHRKWIAKFGGSIRKGSLLKLFSKSLLSSEYTLSDWLNFFKGERFSFEHLVSEMAKINLFEQVSELHVPTFFFIGRYDHQSPIEIVEKYYEELMAPAKELIWFENSAHSPHIEEPLPFLINFLRIKEEILYPRHAKRSLLYL